MKHIDIVESPHLKRETPPFQQGDTIAVHVKVVEGQKERLQIFKGIVISRRGSGTSETMMVRKISHNVGVERIFPIHSPTVDKIEVIKLGKVRRSKLYYMRDRTGKAATRIKERIKAKPLGERENKKGEGKVENKQVVPSKKEVDSVEEKKKEEKVTATDS